MGSDTFYDYELIVCLFRLAQVSNASPRGLASQGLNERVSAGFQPLSRDAARATPVDFCPRPLAFAGQAGENRRLHEAK